MNMDVLSKFDKYKKWLIPLMEGEYAGIPMLKKEAPEKYRLEARELDRQAYERTGRHIVIVEDF